MSHTLTNTQKELLDKPTQELIEAGFLTPDLKITENATYFLRHLAFVENKAKLVARAKEINAENAKKLECKDKSDSE